MKVIKLSVAAANDGDVVSGSLTIQRKKGEAWTNEEVITVVSGQPGADRTLVLDDTQRLLIEGTSNTETVYDRSQNAAVRRPIERPNVVATPPDHDGDEDTPRDKTAEGAIGGAGFGDLQAQERRDQAISEARRKLELQNRAAGEPAPVNEPPIGGVSPLDKPIIPPAPPPSSPPPGFPPAKPKVNP